MSIQPIQTPVGTAEQDDRAITSQHLWEVASAAAIAKWGGGPVTVSALQLIRHLLVDDPENGPAPLLDAVYDEINRSR